MKSGVILTNSSWIDRELKKVMISSAIRGIRRSPGGFVQIVFCTVCMGNNRILTFILNNKPDSSQNMNIC